MIEMALESSMKMGALANSSAACSRRFCLVAVLGQQAVAEQLHVHAGA
jgi:hypothetical protein